MSIPILRSALAIEQIYLMLFFDIKLFFESFPKIFLRAGIRISKKGEPYFFNEIQFCDWWFWPIRMNEHGNIKWYFIHFNKSIFDWLEMLFHLGMKFSLEIDVEKLFGSEKFFFRIFACYFYDRSAYFIFIIEMISLSSF